MCAAALPLFGGKAGWNASEWTASDDSVRGGSSYSSLEVIEIGSQQQARFSGNLDTTTLGGAGFASQRTTTFDKTWDLSAYDGLSIAIAKGDGRQYTFNLKTVLPERRPDGRDNSTLEYAWNFKAPDSSTSPGTEQAGATKLWARWAEFEPSYRGRKPTDAPPLDTTSLRRFSIMIRSFFNEQHGPFDLTIDSIEAIHLKGSEEKL